MKWHHVQENWSAFYEAIQDKWPEADEAELDEIGHAPPPSCEQQKRRREGARMRVKAVEQRQQ